MKQGRRVARRVVSRLKADTGEQEELKDALAALKEAWGSLGDAHGRLGRFVRTTKSPAIRKVLRGVQDQAGEALDAAYRAKQELKGMR